MFKWIKSTIRSACRLCGYDIVPYVRSGFVSQSVLPPDFGLEITDVVRRVQPFTMTGPERIHALCSAVEYIEKHCIPGNIVECGVWKGGSMMAVALTLQQLDATNRQLYLFDTFEGMSNPSDIDRSFRGEYASTLLETSERENANVWAYCPLEEVQNTLYNVDYPNERIHFVKGRVEETIPDAAPDRIAILRLDTDWYESTYHELVHLYPRLSVGGVLIIDDYGHWEGARRAVDEYVRQNALQILLNRIDYTGRIAVKLRE